MSFVFKHYIVTLGYYLLMKYTLRWTPDYRHDLVSPLWATTLPKEMSAGYAGKIKYINSL